MPWPEMSDESYQVLYDDWEPDDWDISSCPSYELALSDWYEEDRMLSTFEPP